jgi:CRISPR-associated exonuclease Cas4
MNVQRYDDDECIALSAIQHLRFCERQCALIHVEQEWEENRLTVEGKQLHERVHAGGREYRKDIRTEFGVRLKSSQLGLAGVADVVEFHAVSDGEGGTRWLPYPVEYKHGTMKADSTDMVQLCAQAIALEEATGETVGKGAIYYGKDRRRQEVEMDADLRTETIALAARLHTLLDSGILPPPVADRRCLQCSLREKCLPDTIGKKMNVRDWFERMIIEKDAE